MYNFERLEVLLRAYMMLHTANNTNRNDRASDER